MEVSEATKTEILSLLNGFYFDEHWDKRNVQVTAEDIRALNPMAYNLDFLLPNLTALLKEKLIEIAVNPEGVVKDAKAPISFTPVGEERARSLVEIYWPKTSYWNKKYPRFEKLLLTKMDDENDWLFMRALAKKLSFSNAYTMDEPKMQELLESIKPNPAPGRFFSKMWSLNGRVWLHGNRTPKVGTILQTWKMSPRYLNYFVEDPTEVGRSLETVKKLYPVLANMHVAIKNQTKTKEEFLSLLTECGGKVEGNANDLLETLGRMEIITFQPVDFQNEPEGNYRITLSHELGHKYHWEWEHHFLQYELHPQSNFFYQLPGIADVRFDRALRQFVVTTSVESDNELQMLELMGMASPTDRKTNADQSANAYIPKPAIVEWLQKYVKSQAVLEQYLGTFKSLNMDDHEAKFQQAASSIRECLRNTLNHLVLKVEKKTGNKPPEENVDGELRRTRKGDARYLAEYFYNKKAVDQAKRLQAFADQVDYSYTLLSAATHAGISDKERENKAMAGLSALETVLFQLMDWASLDEPLDE